MRVRISMPRRGLRRLGSAALVVALGWIGVPVAGAQSSYVNLDVRTRPAQPQPGDDVSVDVRITQCPPGATLVEVLLTSSDEKNDSAALMGETLARTTLLWRTRATVDLPAAIEGWYGVRVQCGTFVPPHVPMANSSFAVGANPTKEARLSGTEVEEGRTLNLSGTGCPGATVEYEVQQYNGRTSTFVPTGTLPVAPDGSWGGDITFDPDLTFGLATVEARCAIQNRYGQLVYISYGRPFEVRVLRAAEGTAPPIDPGAGAAPGG